jgi:hypothetical protein
VLRRLFSRQQPHRAGAPTVEAWSKDGRIDIAVRNNDSETAVAPRLVLMLASGETSEHERVEVDLDSIEPRERAVTSVRTTRRSVFRAWWFLTWQAAGVQQKANGNIDVG